MFGSLQGNTVIVYTNASQYDTVRIVLSDNSLRRSEHFSTLHSIPWQRESLHRRYVGFHVTLQSRPAGDIGQRLRHPCVVPGRLIRGMA